MRERGGTWTRGRGIKTAEKAEVSEVGADGPVLRRALDPKATEQQIVRLSPTTEKWKQDL